LAFGTYLESEEESTFEVKLWQILEKILQHLTAVR